MRKALLLQSDGSYIEECAYEIDDFPWHSIKPNFFKSNRKKGMLISDSICTFDIETTSLDRERPVGYMYHWQMCIDGICVYGRRWEEWIEFMEMLHETYQTSETRKLIIYVHNLGFEFQFIRRFLDKYMGRYRIFAAQKRKPIYCLTGNGIEFRCSWKQSNMSLNKATNFEKGVKYVKSAGDLDYSWIRTADTYLSLEEFSYCINDVKSLWNYIKQSLSNNSDNLETIPLTSTGYVRRDCYRSVRSDKKYFDDLHKMDLTVNVYQLLKLAARGGDTHANRYMSGLEIDDVDSYDVSSSYPYQLLTGLYPITKFTPYGSIDSYAELYDLIDSKACLFKAFFTGLRIKKEYAFPYISTSKCIHLSDYVADNGRLITTIKNGAYGFAEMCITDIDYKIIENMYEWEDCWVYDMHTADYGPLPEKLKEPILDYFKKKSILKKQIEEAEEKLSTCKSESELRKILDDLRDDKYYYAKSKNKLNAIFGMMFTDPIHDEIYIDTDYNWETADVNIEKALNKYNSSRNTFLNYAWGVWTTALSRRHLYDLVNAAGQDASIYCDTDSDKCYHPDKKSIEKMNILIKEKCNKYGAFVDIGEKRYYLGVYELETKDKSYEKFKTLGAKKYAYIYDGELHVTVSGVNKSKAPAELKTLDNFENGFVFKRAGSKKLYYNDYEGIHYITINGCRMLTADNIAVLDGEYTLGQSEDYIALLNDIR